MAAGVLDPGVINGWGHGSGHSAGADVPNDVERLLERVVHAQHVVPPLGLVSRLFHEAALVRRRVQVGQQLMVDEGLRLGQGLERSEVPTTPAENSASCCDGLGSPCSSLKSNFTRERGQYLQGGELSTGVSWVSRGACQCSFNHETPVKRSPRILSLVAIFSPIIS